MPDVLADLIFDATIVEWRGPAPFHFAPIPAEHVAEVRWAAREASYGWGCVPVEAEADGVAFRTSLFPRGDGYMLPLKASVRKQAGLAPGGPVRIRMVVRVSAAR